MKIISGRNDPILARSIANILKADYIETNISHFEDSELKIQVLGDLCMSDVIIIQSTSKPANDSLMELLLLANAAKVGNARNITAVVPYLGYSRQDHLSHQDGPISASLVANVIEASGIDSLFTVDLHSEKVKSFFKIPVQNISPVKCFLPYLKHYKNSIVVSPDEGGTIRAGVVSSLLGMELAVINKSRDFNNKCSVHDITGRVDGRHCILIDDIIDTGDTISQAAELLIEQGALSVDVFVTHPVFSKNAEQNICDSKINKIYVTNTIPFYPSSSKFKVINIDNLLAEELRHC